MVVPTPEPKNFADAEPEVEATQDRGISDDLNMIETVTLFAGGVRWTLRGVSGTMGISTDDSQRYLDELVDDGWIEIVNRSKDPDETVYQATASRSVGWHKDAAVSSEGGGVETGLKGAAVVFG